jgi:hypothetical protein
VLLLQRLWLAQGCSLVIALLLWVLRPRRAPVTTMVAVERMLRLRSWNQCSACIELPMYTEARMVKM